MECIRCQYYRECPTSNACTLTRDENFHRILDCELINDDGSINKEELNNLRILRGEFIETNI